MPLFFMLKKKPEVTASGEKEKEMEEILRKRDTFQKFTSYKEMEKLLDVMSKTDQWLSARMANMKIRYVNPGTSPEYIYEGATAEQVGDAYRQGTMTLKVDGKNYLLNPTAYLTLGQSTETCCRLLSKFLSKEHFAEAASFYNEGFSFLGKENVLLIRGKQVMAFFSKNYCILEQKQVFQRTNELLLQRFPGAVFVKGSYAPQESNILYQLCGAENQLFAKYKDAWEKSGFDTQELKNAKVFARVTTGDTGEVTFKITPLIYTRSFLPLGEAVKIKHYGKVGIKDVEAVVFQIFSNLEGGMNRLAEMMEIDIAHPLSCIKKIVKEIGLERIFPSVVETLTGSVEILEAVRKFDPNENRITAFTLYQTLMDIQYYPAFQHLGKQTKLKIWECFFRASALDWTKF